MIEYRPEDHTYWLDGVEVPSVTRLIRQAGFGEDYDANPMIREHADRAAARSRAVHSAVEHWEQSGILPELSAAQKPFLDSYVRWRESPEGEHMTVLGSEVRLYSPHLGGYAGTADIVAKLDGSPAIVDLKARVKGPGRYDWWQLAAYAFARWGDCPPARRVVLHLKNDGRMAKMHESADWPDDWSSFETILRWWHLRRMFGTK